MQVINSNPLSLMSQNNLSKSRNDLGVSIERLSSGIRVNSAKDDASGLAISNNFTSNINGLNQATRNANDAISLAKTTESSLGTIMKKLQDLRNTVIKSGNGTYSDSDYQYVENDFKACIKEIDRISAQTDYNGLKTLNEDKILRLQTGAHDGQYSEIALHKVNAEGLGIDKLNPGVLRNLASVGTKVKTIGGEEGAKDAEANLTQSDVDKLNELFFKGEKSGPILTIENTDGSTSFVANLGSDKSPDYKCVNITKIENGNISFSAVSAAKEEQKEDFNVLGKIDNAIKKVNESMANLGLIGNNMESIINNQQVNILNLTEARSRIMDADFAEEVSNLSRNSILQNAGMSVLKQANQIPQAVTALL